RSTLTQDKLNEFVTSLGRVMAETKAEQQHADHVIKLAHELMADHGALVERLAATTDEVTRQKEFIDETQRSQILDIMELMEYMGGGDEPITAEDVKEVKDFMTHPDPPQAFAAMIVSPGSFVNRRKRKAR